MLSSILLLNSCGNVEDGEFDSTVDQEVEATKQGVMMFGFDWVGNFHIKNGAGNFCAQAYGNVLSTNTCDNSNVDQLFAVYKMADGKYNLCKRGITYKKDGYACLLQYFGQPCSVPMFGHTATAECLYPTNFKNESPKDYRFYRGLLSYAEGNYSNGTYGPWQTTEGVIAQSGEYLKTGKHYMTRNAAMVVVPDTYAGTVSQRWSWY